MSDTPLPPGKRFSPRNGIVWDTASPEYAEHRRKIKDPARHRAAAKRYRDSPKGREHAAKLSLKNRSEEGRALSRARNRIYCQRYPEKVQLSQRLYRQRHREKLIAACQCYRRFSEATFIRRLWKALLAYTKRYSKSRKAVSVTLESLNKLWIAQKGLCAISGKRMLLRPRSLYSGSIDRIDNSRGYCADNIQFVCLGINYAKNRYSQAEILYFLQHDRAPSESDPKQLEFAW